MCKVYGLDIQQLSPKSSRTVPEPREYVEDIVLVATLNPESRTLVVHDYSSAWAGGKGPYKQNRHTHINYWINVRDPLYFLVYGIPYIYEKRILFSS